MQVPKKEHSNFRQIMSRSLASDTLSWLSNRLQGVNTAALDRLLDRLLGISTTGNVALKELGITHDESVHYVPSGWLTLARLSKIIPFSEQDVFVDFGAGKGRIVVMAARHYPFKTVIGVEISPDLTRIAQDNVDKNYHKLKCKKVELVTSDVLKYEIPRDITIAYLYTPFTGSIFKSVIDRIDSSLNCREDRRLWIVLQRPIDSPSSAIYDANNEVLQKCDWLEQVDEVVSRSSWITVYKATGS